MNSEGSSVYPISHLLGPPLIRLTGLLAVVLLPLWFNPWADVAFEPAKIALFLLLVLLAGSIALPTWLRKPDALAAPPRALRRWLSAYLAIIAAATFASVDPPASLWGTPNNLHGALVLAAGPLFALLLLLSWRTLAARQRQVTALILGSVPVTLYGLIQALGLDPLSWTTDAISPVLSTLGRSNFLGAYLALIIPFTLARLWEPLPSGLTLAAARWRYGVVLALQVTCLLLTQARGAWLGATVAVAACLGLLAYRWRDRRLALAALLVCLLGGAWLLLMNRVSLVRQPTAASASAPFVELRLASTATRLLIWRTSAGLIGPRWLLGYGPATFTPVFKPNSPAELTSWQDSAIVTDPHNLVLDQWLTLGLAGLLALVTTVVTFYRLTWRGLLSTADRPAHARSAAALAAVTGFLVQAQFNPNVIVTLAIFWIAMMLGVAEGHS
ncbi:MAG: O-antigen ligase family protein [Anaerolineae bacterium]